MEDKDNTRTFEPIKVTYTSDQLRELGQQLARENQEVYNLERKKKLDNAEISLQIKAANDKAAETTTKINNGYEMEEIEVMAMMDSPSEGMKTIIRVDTSEPIRTAPMTPEERQRRFNFDAPENFRFEDGAK